MAQARLLLVRWQEHLLLIVARGMHTGGHDRRLVRRLLLLELRLVNELVLRLRHNVQRVRLVLLVLLHLLAADVGPLLKDDPDKAFQSEHIALVERVQLLLVETVREGDCEAGQGAVLGLEDLKVDLVDLFLEHHRVVEPLHALPVLDVGRDDDQLLHGLVVVYLPMESDSLDLVEVALVEALRVGRALLHLE